MVHVDEAKQLRQIGKVHSASLLLTLSDQASNINFDLIECRRHAPRSAKRLVIPAQLL